MSMALMSMALAQPGRQAAAQSMRASPGSLNDKDENAAAVNGSGPTQPGAPAPAGPEGHLEVVAKMPAWLLQALESSALTLHYGRFEQCSKPAVSLLLQGRLHEDRPVDKPQTRAALIDLLVSLERNPRVAGPGRLSGEHFEALLQAGSLALGPLARQLSQRIASLTDDPSLAYRAFAESIESPVQRKQFLAGAPKRTRRTLYPGDWLGWAHLLGLEAEPRACHASRDSSLHVWSADAMRKAWSQGTAAEQIQLLQWLRVRAPGCENLSASRLRNWLQSS